MLQTPLTSFISLSVYFSYFLFLSFLFQFCSVFFHPSNTNRITQTHTQKYTGTHTHTHNYTQKDTDTHKEQHRKISTQKHFSGETSTQIHFNDSEREESIQVGAFGRSDFLKTLQL